MSPATGPVPTLSVVIPSFDSAPWLPSTLDALATAIDEAGSSAVVDVIVVDDGSGDGTAHLVENLAPAFPAPLRVLRQSNQGRFLARFHGAEAAAGELLMLLDSRVLIDAPSIRDAVGGIAREPTLCTWNAHIVTDPDAPLVGLFWEVPTSLFWGEYLRRPRRLLITARNFDRVPKGTTCFLVPRALFLNACRHAWPEGDSRWTSDDTRLLREIVRSTDIVIDPTFSARYRPRTSVAAFLRHSRDRGTLFVDSYAGTSPLRDTILFALAVAPVAVAALLVVGALVLWPLLIATIAVGVLGLAAPAVAATARGLRLRSVRAYLAFIVPFAGVFWAGLVRGIVIHRHRFGRIAR